MQVRTALPYRLLASLTELSRRHLGLILISLLAVACYGSAEEAELGATAAELTGGARDTGSPNVVLLLSWDSANAVGTLGTCTAEVVAPDVLLTAAHCLASRRQNYAAYLGHDGKNLGTPIDPSKSNVRAQLQMAKSVHAHPQYVTTQGYYDVGIVILQNKLSGIPLMPITRTVPSASAMSNVTIIGYGKTFDGDTSFAVTKYRAEGLKAKLDATHTLTVGDNVRHACVGDSGGPVLGDIDGVPTIIGVDSYSDETGDASRCRMPSHYQRVDVYLSFIDQYVPRAATGTPDAGVDASLGSDAGSDASADGGKGDAGGWSDAGSNDAGSPNGSVYPSAADAGTTTLDSGPLGNDGGMAADGGITMGGAPLLPIDDADDEGCNASGRSSRSSFAGVSMCLLLVGLFAWRRRAIARARLHQHR